MEESGVTQVVLVVMFNGALGKVTKTLWLNQSIVVKNYQQMIDDNVFPSLFQ